MRDVDGVMEELGKSAQLAVFGAGNVAFGVINCLLGEPYRLRIDCLMVSRRCENPDQVMGIPVVGLESAGDVVRRDAVIVVAAMEKQLASIEEGLHRHGYFRLIPMTFESDLWCLVQGKYYRERRLACRKPCLSLEEAFGGDPGKEPGKGPGKGPEKEAEGGAGRAVSVYAAKCHADRQVREDLARFSWEIPIQAGAALTDRRICGIRDDAGDSISRRNRQYCELTALYWIWKHDRSAYAGLCHYRRHFELGGRMPGMLAGSGIDVVVTHPVLNFPSVREVYRRDHAEGDWDAMLEAVRVLSPDCLPAAVEVQNGNWYYGYNMLIARKEILDSYCGWLFPILERCRERCGEKADPYQNRYLGFLGERLMTVYLKRHESRLRIAHAGRHFVDG